jgi:ribosomal protein L10
MLKKSLINYKSNNILQEYPIILCFHYNNKDIENWHYIKKKLSKIENIKSSVFHNKIAHTIQTKNSLCIQQDKFEYSNREKLLNLFQGPTFVIGCNKLEDIIKIKNLFINFSNLLFIGGFYKNQPLSYYTLNKLIKLDQSTVLNLINILNLKLNFLHYFQKNKKLSLLFLLKKLSKDK